MYFIIGLAIFFVVDFVFVWRLCGRKKSRSGN